MSVPGSPPAIAEPVVAVVVVTYNSAAVLEGCLDSLAEGCGGVAVSEVIIADNASQDGSVALALARSELPVHAVQLGRNAGYAAAINAGIASLRRTGIDAVLVLNPDIRLRPGAVAALARVLRQTSHGIAVPRLVHPDGTLQPSLRREPSLVRALAQAVLGGRRAGRIGQLSETVTDPRRYERPGPAAWATGAAMLISWPAVTGVGPWDESFLLYSEETEFALRAADRGWGLWYEPAAVAEHLGGESGTNPVLWALLTVNKVRLFRRRHGVLAGAAFFTVVTAGELARAAAGRRTARAAVAALLIRSRRLHALPDEAG